MLTDTERGRLLAIAREAIVAHIRGTALDDVLLANPDNTRGGAFVTLHRGRELRGCIGHVERDDLLGRVVAQCAVAASSSDPRFPPVTAGEVDELSIEISVLGPLEPIAGPGDIEIGPHGLLVEKGSSRELLLPQVATEWGWDREQFLAQTCRKAGLSSTAWKSGATLWRFEAEVFGEPR